MYIKAKDESKPMLMRDVFSANATLEMKVQSENISFPESVIGLSEITDTLVRNFNESYENIYTFCFTDSVRDESSVLACRWLVGMTDKNSGSARVGVGNYRWEFENGLAKSLIIVIETMIVLPQKNQIEVMSWLGGLPYPWVLTSAVEASVPDIDLLSEVRANLDREF